MLCIKAAMARWSLVLCVVVVACFSLQPLNEATTIYVHNQCGTVCSKYWVSGLGGSCSDQGMWTVGASSAWVGGVVWGITSGCSGQACNTGPPEGVTLFQITVAGSGGNDYYDISMLSGYNLPMSVVPTNGGCPIVDFRGNSASTFPEAYLPPGIATRTKACATGTDYNVYLCP